MSSKEKKSIKIIIISLIILLISLVLIYILKKNEKITYAYEENNVPKTVKISNAEKVDLDKIMKKNSTQSGYVEKIIVEERELEYITKYVNSDDIYIGQTAVTQEGRNGIQAITIKKVYDENGKLVKEEQVSAVVVKSSLNKIIEIGTKERKKEIQNGTSNGLNFNMALNRPSGFTLEQFKKALTDNRDKNKTFEENAKYFYYI